jgi:hypothetical protein
MFHLVLEARAMQRACLAMTMAIGAWSANCAHATITAGPHGQFQTVQAAINALLASGSEIELRVEGNARFTENLTLSITANRAFHISGGWDSTFTTQSPSAASTVLDGGHNGGVLIATVSVGSLMLNNFTFTNGLLIQDGSGGGGINLKTLSATAQARLANLAIDNNYALTTTAIAGSSAVGGGIVADAQAGSIEIDGPLSISNNRVLSLGNSPVAGGGVYFRAFQNATIAVLGTPTAPVTIYDNVADGGATAYSVGGGCAIVDSGHVEMHYVEVADNAVRGLYGYRSGCDAVITDGGSFTFMQSALFGNVEETQNHSGTSQAYFLAGRNATIEVRDSAVSRGADAGLHIGGNTGTTMRLVNLSISGNAIGLLLDTVTGVSLYNSIVAQNDQDLVPAVLPAGDHNLIGGDPHFVANDPLLHIRADSPARDTGNDTPPSGISSADIDGATRVFQSHVDIGADEIGDPIFTNGFQ